MKETHKLNKASRILELNGQNYWEARLEARKLLNIPFTNKAWKLNKRERNEYFSVLGPNYWPTLDEVQGMQDLIKEEYMPLTKPNECECCPTKTTNLVFKYGMWMCNSCIEKEEKLQKDNNTSDAVNRRIAEATTAIQKHQAQLESIELREDLFNADTVAIIDLKKEIDANPEIPEDKKVLRLAEALHARYLKFAQVIFERREANLRDGNSQRAIQTYMNTLSNQLRVEERERLRLSDINYKPDVVKDIKPRTTRKPRTSKFDKTELKNLAAQYNIPLEAIQITAMQKNLALKEAALAVAKLLHPTKY